MYFKVSGVPVANVLISVGFVRLELSMIIVEVRHDYRWFTKIDDCDPFLRKYEFLNTFRQIDSMYYLLYKFMKQQLKGWGSVFMIYIVTLPMSKNKDLLFRSLK